MGRVCAVPGCNSGSAEDRRQRIADEVRKCSVFGVPKDLQVRKIWSDELGIELKNNDAICELHFEYENLNISDDYLFINGEVVVSIRERVTLKTNARPVRSLVGAYERRKAVENEFRLNKVRKYYVKLPQTAKEKSKPIETSAETVQLSNSIVSQDIKMEEVEVFDSCSSNDEKYGHVKVENNIDEHMTGNDYLRVRNQSSLPDTVFEIPNLVDILKRSCLKQNWAWGEKDGDIFFTLIDVNVLTIRCYMQVHSNMKVTISLNDKQNLVNFRGINAIKSYEDLTEILQRLENEKLCLGTGLTQKRRSETCAISTMKSDICSFCLREKTKLEELKLSTENKCNNLSKSSVLLKKKHNYSSKKLHEARNRIA